LILLKGEHANTCSGTEALRGDQAFLFLVSKAGKQFNQHKIKMSSAMLKGGAMVKMRENGETEIKQYREGEKVNPW
jgi:hypothetical protein